MSILYSVLHALVRATCPVNLFYVLIVIVISGEKYSFLLLNSSSV
jgi:hypothetical protein